MPLPDVRGRATDHVPVLVAALPARDVRGRERVRRTTWRLESLQDADQATAYRAQVQSRILQACVDGGVDMTVQRLAAAVTAGITMAAHATIGQRVVVQRITVPWLTELPTKQAIRDRRTAHTDMVTAATHLERLQNRRARDERSASEAVVLAGAWRAHEATLAFHACQQLATAAVKAARRKWRTKCADRLNYNVLRRPSSRHTYALLLRSSQAQVGSTGPEELLMPGTTEEYHDTVDGMLACFARHYESLGTPAPACTPHRQHRRDWARTRAVALDTLTANEPCILDSPFTEEEVDRALRRMANNKAPGHDQLPAELLKYSGPAGRAAITALFNAVLCSCELPSQWRDGRIVNLHKTGARDDCGNYRGITLLPAIDKLCMATLSSRLLAFVALYDRQYGFVRSKGTYDALFNLITTMDAQRDNPDNGDVNEPGFCVPRTACLQIGFRALSMVK